MRYRVLRDIGDSDYPVGRVFDGAALSERRRVLLVEQRRIEPLPEVRPEPEPEPDAETQTPHGSRHRQRKG